MSLSRSKAIRACVIAVITGGLSLAAVIAIHNVARAESWCTTVGGSQECFPTMAACKAAHPTLDCTRGPG
jgi:hypothetical protein